MSVGLVDIDFSFNCDSTGAGSVTLIPHATHFCVFNVIGLTTGGANWTVLLNGRPIKLGHGPRTEVGPIPSQPGDRITISVQNAVPLASATGKLSGPAASTLPEALTMYSPAPSMVSLEVGTALDFIGLTTLPVSSTIQATHTIPQGAAAAIFTIIDRGSTTSVSVVIQGQYTGNTYYQTPAGAFETRGVPIVVTGINPADLSTGPFGGGILATWTTGAGPASQRVLVQAQVPNLVAISTPAVVTAVGQLPALWQAPNQFVYVERTSVGITQMQAGVAGQNIYVFDLWLSVDAASFAAIEDAGPAPPAGRMLVIDTTLGVSRQTAHPAGVPISQGKDLQLNVSTIPSGSVRAFASVNQG